jgi:hypothetical protein
MLLTLGTCNCGAGISAREYALRYHSGAHPGAKRVSTIGATSPWGRKCNTCGTRDCRSSTDCTDTSQRCHNYSCGRRAVKRSTRYHARIGTIPPRIPLLLHNDQLHPYHHRAHACYQTVVLYGYHYANGTTSMHWGWFPFTYHSMDRQSMFCSWGCIQRPQQSSLVRDNPHAIGERGYSARFIVSVWAI